MLSSYTSTKNKQHKEQAQAIVEFAIVLPILLMILIGLLEVGRMIFQYTAVTNASREAARYASAVGLADGTSSQQIPILFRDKGSGQAVRLCDEPVRRGYRRHL